MNKEDLLLVVEAVSNKCLDYTSPLFGQKIINQRGINILKSAIERSDMNDKT